MKESKLSWQVKTYLENTPKEVLDKEFEELSYWNTIGPTADEYIKFAEENFIKRNNKNKEKLN